MSWRRVPVTPAIWIVVWASMTVGFIQGILDATTMAVLSTAAFVQKFADFFFQGDVAKGLQNYRKHVRRQPPRTVCWADGKFVEGRLAWYSSLGEIGACAGTVAAAWLSASRGRRTSIRAGCFVLVVGMALKASAYHVAQLITGAVLAGLGLGLMFQATLLEDAEVAPATYRGTFTSLLELGYTAGNAVIFGVMAFPEVATSYHDAWRFVFTIPLWPAAVLLVLLFFIPETPSSLIQRGFFEKGQEALSRIRGPFYSTAELTEETMGIWKAANDRPTPTDQEKTSWLLRQLRSMFQLRQLPPALVVFTLTVLLWFEDSFWRSPAMLEILKPMFFNSNPQHSKDSGEILPFLVVSGTAFIGTLAAVLLVDRLGRRFIFISGGLAAIAVQTVMLAVAWPASSRLPNCDEAGKGPLHHQPDSNRARVVGVLHCVHMGLRGWLWPACTASVTEHFPLCSRSMLVALLGAASYVTSAVVDFWSGEMLFHLKTQNLIILVMCDLITVIVAWQLLPEASRVPIEKVQEVWQQHRVWQRFYSWVDRQQESSRHRHQCLWLCWWSNSHFREQQLPSQCLQLQQAGQQQEQQPTDEHKGQQNATVEVWTK